MQENGGRASSQNIPGKPSSPSSSNDQTRRDSSRTSSQSQSSTSRNARYILLFGDGMKLSY